MKTSVTAGPVTILSVQGDVDGHNFRDLIANGEQVVNQGHARLIVDLHQVNFMSSSGLLALQSIAAKAMDKGGKMVLVGLNANVERIIELAGFDKVFCIFDEVAAAQASFDTC